MSKHAKIYNMLLQSLEVAYPGTPASQQLIPRRSTATPPDYMVCYMAAQRIDEPNVDMHDSLLPYGALFLQVYPREEVNSCKHR